MSSSTQSSDACKTATETTRSTKPSKGTNKRLKEFGIKAPNQDAKNFVLDTNVLLHDPGCLNRFANNHVCIPSDVLSELDRFKNEQSERGANARAVHRRLTAMFTGDVNVTAGVPTDGGGSVRVRTGFPDRSRGCRYCLRHR